MVTRPPARRDQSRGSAAGLGGDRKGTFLAVLLGTTIVTTFLLLLTSGQPRVPDRLADFGVVVTSPAADNRPDEFAEPVPWSAAAAQSLVERLRSVPGVDAVAVDRRFYAQPMLDGRPVAGSTAGHAWLGESPPPPGEVIVDRSLGVSIGAPLTLLTATGPQTWRVGGHTDWRGVYFSPEEAARLSPGVRAIGVSGAASVEAVRAAVGSAGIVSSGDARGIAEPRSDARTRWIGMQVLTATTALAGFACVFLIASTSAYAVDQRRREIGLLRAVGATPRQIRSMLHRSALLLGVRAAPAGVLLGGLASIVLARFLVGAGLEPHGYGVRWQPWVLAVAFGAGPLISLMGAVMPARRAARISPIEALRVAAVEPRAMSHGRWITGLTTAAAAVGAGVAAASAGDMQDVGTYALFGAMALVAAAALLAPAVVPALIRLLLGPWTGITAVLARESARVAVRRTASTAAPVLFTVAFAVFVTGTAQTSAAAWETRRANTIATESVLVPDGTPGLPDSAAAGAPLDTTVYIRQRAVQVSGADSVADGTALVSAGAAERYGPSVTVTFADGERETLRVAGTAPPVPLAADLVLGRDIVRKHDSSALAPGAYPVPPGPVPAGAKAASPGELARQADAEDDRLVRVFTMLLLAVSAGAGALAVANTLLMTARRRGPDHRVLRLAGASRGQVLGAVTLETTLVVAIGSLLGGAAGLIAIAGSARSLGAQIGDHVPISISWPAVAASIVCCLALALAAALWRPAFTPTRDG
ncbi:ABC transporter permease [Paractinoplanes atraurantiacus]|uniref:Putative ABC transport system permease protein n=1 Tax=Paractinoplanes atraurantiacus TaxID=1036182 RepID=A0A285JLW5_9ACTN|nr:FtsX-like permease family protein [Actinoplanes atraurantiacus]SNY61274.1 putative ABC transport system permease protein [Actinoplanes atraurantiacus]